jgi:hypothetical protein
MNILEAIETVKNGTGIRYQAKGKSADYIIQTTLLPVGLKEFKRIDLDDARREDTYPENLADICLFDLDDVCLEAILSESFTAIPIGDILGEIQTAWKKFNEEDEE